MSPVNEKKPSLRISHIAYGRQSVGNKVKYLVDPKVSVFKWFETDGLISQR